VVNLLEEFFGNIKRNKYLYGLLLSPITVIILITGWLEFADIIKEDYTLRMISYCLFILIYLIYIGGKFKI